MAQCFLASVGRAEAYRKVNNELVHFFSAKTLTDSSINISVSAEEVRGGQGAKLLGQFFHTSVFGLTMTDAMFKLEYLQAQTGGIIENGGFGLKEVSLTTDSTGKMTLPTPPVAVLEGQNTVVWYNAPGDNNYMSAVVPVGTTEITVPGAEEGSTYCVHYWEDKASARKLIVPADFVPYELVVFLTTRLYAGDASARETGKPVGEVTVKIPRFQLNGTVDLAMEMASPATIALEGNALAYDDDCNGAKYAEIVEYIGTSIYNGFEKLVADEDYISVGDVPVVYAVGSKKTPMHVDNAEISFTYGASQDALDETTGEIKAGVTGEVTMTLTVDAEKGTTLTGSFTVGA